MMKKTSLWLVAATAAGFALGFAGCGDTMPMPSTCTSDMQCSASQACHPILRTCVASCTGAVDCPDSSKTCATFGGLASGNDAGVRAFCQCATDQLCERGSAGQVCQPASKICGAKCTNNAGCPTGSTCDVMTGKCGGATATDAGMDGGMGDGGTVTDCTPGSCMAPQICDPMTRRCAAAAACSSANPQPDTCAYGLTCSGASCTEAPRTGVGCANFTSLPTPTLWNPSTVTTRGPVTVTMASIAKDTVTVMVNNEPNGFCGRASGAPRFADFSAEANLYSGSTNFPAMLELLPAGFLNYVRSDGQTLDIKGSGSQQPLARPTGGYSSGLSNNNKNLRLRFSLCVMGTPPATLSAGFYGENGNAVCATLQ